MMSPKSKSHLRSTIGLDMLVRDVMTTDVITVQKFESVLAVADILASRNISGIPVVDKQGKVVGIITQADILSVVGIRKDRTFKDLLKHMLGEPLQERRMGDIVGDVMTAQVLTTTPETNIAEVVRIMDEKKIRRLIVVDEKNKLAGIISRADILKAVLRKLK
ncbi:MAG: CBS domain-containing protein [Nitrospirae bacterium]|nr:CBS domain-containing protein [Nitrospirota bacterium]